MGLYEKLFGSAKNTVSVKAKAYKEDWDSYLSNVDGKVGSIMVDLGFHTIAPMTDKPNVLWVTIKMNNPDSKNGLSSKDETDALWKIEDALTAKLVGIDKMAYVGRLTSDERRQFYFYLYDTSVYNRAVSNIMSSFPAYKFECGTKADKSWDGYLNFLYPSPKQMQINRNTKVIYTLEKSGDKLIAARNVDHWIYFKTESDRELFLSKIKNDGFKIEDKSFDNRSQQFPYKLRISRTDKVDEESVNNYCLKLWEVAAECDGDYDGWETVVVK